MKIVLVAGARPNFMKIAPILRAIDKHNASAEGKTIEPFLVHTGQHYDYEMSQMRTKQLILSALVGVVITLISGLISNTSPMLLGAVQYGYPFPWLFRRIVAPEYFPWAVDTGNLVVDIVLWSIVAGIVLVLLNRRR